VGQTETMRVYPEPQWQSDLGPASWIAPNLHPFNQDTGSVVPEGFEAYCRLFHPAEISFHRPVAEPPSGRQPMRWTEIAIENGRVAHPEMQFHAVNSGPASTRWHNAGFSYEPLQGRLPSRERAALIEILRDATATPERCWFCIWDGYGVGIPTPLVEHTYRSYGLYEGDIDVAMVLLDPPFDHSPNLWWPDDRSWIVATEIDYAWTYVGGSSSLIAQVLRSPSLEALPVSLSDMPFFDADTINTDSN
jgi:hypothetical protein